MNFFDQEDNTEDSLERGFNFIDSDQETFNFNQDTFAPEELTSYQNSFAPINIK